jgi:hypothetical protein
MVHVLGKQRLVKVVSAVVVSVLSGGAAWGMTAATASVHPSRVHPSEIDGSTTSSVDETTTSESTTTESTTTTDSTTTTESTTTTTTTLDATPPPSTCNHGADVSKVAHEAPRGHGNEHGKAVSAAAHLKCGDAADGAEADKPDEAKPEPDTASDNAAHASKTTSSHGEGSGND